VVTSEVYAPALMVPAGPDRPPTGQSKIGPWSRDRFSS
jgi:hypothetical protein